MPKNSWDDIAKKARHGLRGMSILLRPAVLGLHPKIRGAVAEEYDRMRASEGAIETLKERVIQAEEYGSDDLRRLANLGLYVLLFMRDQGMLKVDWFQTIGSDTLRRGFIARQWITLLWDVADKMRGQAFGREMRETIQVIGAGLVPEMNRINKTAARFWDRHGDELKRWRNAVAAHRDFNAFLQLQLMDDIDLRNVFPIAAAFNEVTSPTVTFVRQVFEQMTIKEYVLILKRARKSGID